MLTETWGPSQTDVSVGNLSSVKQQPAREEKDTVCVETALWSENWWCAVTHGVIIDFLLGINDPDKVNAEQLSAF